MDTIPPAQEVKDTNDARYASIAGIVILLYDNFLTLDVEIAFLWTKPWRHSIKSIYLINKYLSAAVTILTLYQLVDLRPAVSLEFCRRYLVLGTVAHLVSEMLSKWILTKRLVALYAQRRAVVYSLYILYALSYLLTGALTFLSIKYNVDGVVVSPNSGECFVQSIPAIFALIFIGPLVYEVYMAILTVYKAYRHAKIIKDISSAPLLHVMFRDGITYFLMMALARVILIWLVVARNSLYLGLSLQWCVDVVLVSRFYLNLLEVASRSTNISIWGKQGPSQSQGVSQMSTELGVFAVNPTSQTSTTVGRSAGVSSFGGSEANTSTRTKVSSNKGKAPADNSRSSEHDV